MLLRTEFNITTLPITRKCLSFGSLITRKNIAFSTRYACKFEFSLPFYRFTLILVPCFRYFDCKNGRTEKWCETAKFRAKIQSCTIIMSILPAWHPSWRDKGGLSSLEDKVKRIPASPPWRVWSSRPWCSSWLPTHDYQGLMTMTPIMDLPLRFFFCHIFRLG